MTLSELSAVPVATNLRVGPLLEDPLGYGEPELQFSWQIPQGRQTAWELRCASTPDKLPEGADLWESGKQGSGQNLFVDYLGEPLGSRDQVFWTVRYWDQDGAASDWSPVASVEMGLLHPADWQGQWMRHPDHPAGEPWFAPHFRKAFAVDAPIERARLYFTAEGIVDFTINGQPANADYFAPGWPDYRKRRLARTVDVTSLLQEGDNVIGAVLADGWFSGNMLTVTRDRFGGIPALLCQLEVSYADGTRRVIASDESWKVGTGAVLAADFYDGEDYDARLETPGWDRPGFDDKGWSVPAVKAVDLFLPISAHAGPAVRVIENRAPVSIKRGADGSTIFDFGVNLVGVPRIALPMKAGQTVVLKFAEALNPDGSPHYENMRRAKVVDRYTAAVDGLAEWSPRFTFHGYRYMELIGMPEDVEPAMEWATSLVLTSEVPSTGTFTSSESDWNQLQQNIRRSQLGNFLEVPTDCPQRDERLGWTGDIQVFGPTASFNYQSLAFIEKWCRDLRDGQFDTGKIPDVAPDVMLNERPLGNPAWGDAIIIVHLDMYQKYGYKKILRDNYKAMIGWVSYYDMMTAANGGLWINHGFSDWLQPYQGEDRQQRGDTSRSLLGTAYYARSAELLVEVARILGETDDAKLFAKRAEVVRERFARTFFENGVLLPREDGKPTQTAYLLALSFDLLPEPDRPAALAELERLIIEEADGHLRTGFVGTALICRTLTRFGREDLAYQVALKESYPSWIYSIREGATSIWERWNSYSREDGFNGASMNSLNHYAYGAVGQWLYESVAGLSEMEPGYRKLKIAPKVGGGLTSASAMLETSYGMAGSSWERNGNRISLEAVVPANADAVVELPDGTVLEVGPGSHQFTSELND